MKWYILAYVMAALRVFTSLFQLSQNREGWYTALGSAIFWGVIGYFLQTRYQNKNNKSNEIKTTNKALLPCDVYAERYVCKVVGVTYKNDDGTSRQEILKSLYSIQDSYDICDLEKYYYEGSPAFYVKSSLGTVGNVPSNCVNDIVDILKIANFPTLLVNQFEDEDGNKKYWAELTIYFGLKNGTK